MIKLIRDYYVDGREGDYALVQDMKKLDKGGNQVFKTICYPSTVNSAVMTLYKRLCRDLTNEETLTLTEAAERFESIANELKAVMPKCFK